MPYDAHGSALRDYLRVARRRKWLILQALVLVPAAAVALSLRQAPLYEAEAQVLLSRQNLAATLTGTPDPLYGQQADRVAQTQAVLASVPEVARRTLAALDLDERTAAEFRAASRVVPQQNADILDFRVVDPDPALAQRLASEYAEQFTIYRSELDTESVERAQEELGASIREMSRRGETATPLYASLLDKQQQLRTMAALQTANAFVVRAAESATRVQPRPVRNGILALVLGLVVGVALAFLREALDTRVRSPEEVQTRLHLPLLARLPEPPRRLRKRNRLVMLADPRGVQAENFRMLRTNLEFTRLARDVRTIMVTSAVEREGKSTTAANLAVAFARAGRSVVLVDLDLRRPYLDRFFDLEGRPGLTQVALGEVELRDALVPVSLGAPAGVNGAGGRPRTPGASLTVIGSGLIPPDPGEFVATARVTEILNALREEADVVIVDAPPALHVGDAMALSTRVDGIVIVARLTALRRGMLTEMHRALDAMPAHKLGVVVTGDRQDPAYGYGYAMAYHYSSAAPKETVA